MIEKTPLKNWMERAVPTNLKGFPVRSISLAAARSLIMLGFRKCDNRLTIQDACRSVSDQDKTPLDFLPKTPKLPFI